MKIAVLDIVVIALYLVLIRLIGAKYTRKSNSLEHYLLASRSLGGWVAGLSLVGTSVSSISFLAYPADAFKTNWLRFLPCLSLPLVIVWVIYFLVPKIKRSKSVTAYEVLEDRYGPSIRIYGALSFLISQLVRVSLILYLISLMTQTMTGLDAWWCVLITGGIAAIYTTRGGFEAVVWTDMIQVVMLTLGGLICLWVIIDLTPGGLTSILNQAIADQKLSVGVMRAEADRFQDPWSYSLSHKTALMMLVVGLTHWLTEYVSNQGSLQRIYASRTQAEARKALWIYVGLSIPLWGLFMMLGTGLYVFFSQRADLVPQLIHQGQVSAEEIVPYFIAHYIPTGLAGLVIAAALAAAMSSLDSSLNAIASVSVHDLYQRFKRPAGSDRHTEEQLLSIARRSTTIAAILMIIGALILLESKSETLQDIIITISSLLSGGLLSLYLIGWYTQRYTTIHVWCGLAVTGFCTLWSAAAAQGWVGIPFDLYYTGLIGNVVMLLTMWLSAIIYPAERRS